MPEADIYLEVLSLKPTEESLENFRKKLDFYERNELDYFSIDVRKHGRELKSIPELKEEIEEQVYSKALGKVLPNYMKKRFIDNFYVRRDGYRKRAGYKVA